MKLRNPTLISATAWLVAGIIRLWIGTLRFRYQPTESRLEPTTPGLVGRYLYLFWHDSLLLPASRYGSASIHVLISQHADGQLIAEAAHKLGYKTIRGSTTRGGMEAMRSLLQVAKVSHVVITPDGPRGPRRIVQPGAIYLASRTGLPIVAIGVGYDLPWRTKSWDRFALPRPLSRAILVSGEPITVPPKADKDTLERYREMVQDEMDRVGRLAEEGATAPPRRSIRYLSLPSHETRLH